MDLLRVGSAGLRTRPLRVLLSALGISIGIAAMVAVVGISSSSRADLDRFLEQLGTNLLTVSPGQSILGEQAVLPQEAPDMVARIGPVTAVAATGDVPDTYVYRNEHINPNRTNGIAVLASELDLLDTVSGTVAEGSWLDAATARYPTVVLGSDSARYLGITRPGVQVWLGEQWFTVIGILNPVPLAPELDTAALVGWEAAEEYLGFDGHPTTIYERSTEDAVEQVRGVLARTANPEHPEEVEVSRPSDALAAQHAVDTTFTGLLLGLGAVALLVGGVGVANTMIISVLERRSEIGLRRALGATQGHIRLQFLVESLLLSGLGGGAGVILGVAVTMGYALTQDWPILVPPWVIGGALGAALLIGGLAGIYPAVRAARLSPTEALTTP